jgi:transcriptional regulator with XRE-family HTH domain
VIANSNRRKRDKGMMKALSSSKSLFQLRSELNLSQGKLAVALSKNKKSLSFSQSSIALYELGLRKPSLDRAKIISSYFDLPVESIIFGPGDCIMKSNKLKPTGSDRNRS